MHILGKAVSWLLHGVISFHSHNSCGMLYNQQETKEEEKKEISCIPWHFEQLKAYCFGRHKKVVKISYLWPILFLWSDNCEDHILLDFASAVLYMKHFIDHFTFIPHGRIRTHKWLAPNVSGFIAQLVRASHRSREVTGSNPFVQASLYAIA